MYKNSVPKALESIYPDKDWKRWRFQDFKDINIPVQLKVTVNLNLNS
jgi:hypothetical protein